MQLHIYTLYIFNSAAHFITKIKIKYKMDKTGNITASTRYFWDKFPLSRICKDFHRGDHLSEFLRTFLFTSPFGKWVYFGREKFAPLSFWSRPLLTRL